MVVSSVGLSGNARMTNKPPVATNFSWSNGYWSIWRKDSWVLQIHFPNVTRKRTGFKQKEIFVGMDTAFRLNWEEKALALVILGFGFGFTTDINNFKHFRNDGQCYHGVSLKRTCKECKADYEKRQESNHV